MWARITCCQVSPRVGDLAGNRARIATAIRGAVGAGADVVVLPELATSGYAFSSRAEAAAAAIPRQDPTFDQWAEHAQRATVVVGFCEAAEDGLLHNSAAVVDATGLRTVYRKVHLWDREQDLFVPGDSPPPIVETRVGRLGVLVCYDLEFPELTRKLALAGADLLVVPTNWPLVPRPDGERPPEVIIAMAAARVNRVAIACCDRDGTERGQAWTAGTAIVDATGWVAASAVDEVASADLDLSTSRNKALGDRNHALDDRRPDVYRKPTPVVGTGHAPVVDSSGMGRPSGEGR